MNVSLWVFYLPDGLFYLLSPQLSRTHHGFSVSFASVLWALLSPETNEGQAEGSCGSDTSLLPCVAMLASGGAGLRVKGQQEDFLCLRQLGV